MSDMLHRLAEAEALPVTSDAPPGEEATPNVVNEAIPYDAGLQQDLIEHGPDALKEWGQIVVRGVRDPARYNSAVWFALAQDPPLQYEHVPDRDVVIIRFKEA